MGGGGVHYHNREGGGYIITIGGYSAPLKQHRENPELESAGSVMSWHMVWCSRAHK